MSKTIAGSDRLILSLATLALAIATSAASAQVRFEHNLAPYNPDKIDEPASSGMYSLSRDGRFLLLEKGGSQRLAKE